MADDVTKRMNYFDRQFLHKEDFQVEQTYHIDRHRRHNRTLHVAGVAEGMDVTGKSGDAAVTIKLGTAIDPEGRDIVLLTDLTVTLTQTPEPNAPALKEGTYDLYIVYKDGETDFSTKDPGVKGNTRIGEKPQPRFDSFSKDPSNTGVRLARLVVNSAGKLASQPDESVRSLAGAKMDGDFEAHKLTLVPYPHSYLPPDQRPRLTCSGPKEVTLDGRLNIDSDLYFTNPNHKYTGAGNALGHAAIENSSDFNSLMILGRTGPSKRVVSLWDDVTVNKELSVGANLSVSGNVGIGAAKPSAKLHLSAGGRFGDIGLFSPANPPTNPGGDFTYNGGDESIFWFVHYGDAKKGSTHFRNATQDLLVIQNTGEVGIGTETIPDKSRLTVVGGALTVGPPPQKAEAAIHITSSFGDSDRLLQMSPTGPSKPGLNLLASHDAAGKEQWWAWGVNTDNKWTILPGTTFNNDKGTEGLTIDDGGNVRVSTIGANQVSTHLVYTDNIIMQGDLNFRYIHGKRATPYQSSVDGILEIQMPVQWAEKGQIAMGYDFCLGHLNNNDEFIKVFSVDHHGTLWARGSKGGFVVDCFINASGQTLERGDIVRITDRRKKFSWGDNIPVAEVVLATEAYDTRVCGIVVGSLEVSKLPGANQDYPSVVATPNGKVSICVEDLMEKRGEGSDSVYPQETGSMVTLGAFAFCKVDADIAPIEVGDLLTTSPTKGHAQKVLNRTEAIGAIIGKALGSLDKGKGKIPVLVTLQ